SRPATGPRGSRRWRRAAGPRSSASTTWAARRSSSIWAGRAGSARSPPARGRSPRTRPTSTATASPRSASPTSSRTPSTASPNRPQETTPSPRSSPPATVRRRSRSPISTATGGPTSSWPTVSPATSSYTFKSERAEAREHATSSEAQPSEWERRADASERTMKVRRAVIVCLLAGAAFAAPTVTVSAKTRLTIDEVARGGAGVHVRGALLDAGTGEGIAGRTVEIRTDAVRALATTAVSGRYDAVLALPAGEHRIAARFAGDDTFGAAQAEGSYGVGRGTLRLELTAQGGESTG